MYKIPDVPSQRATIAELADFAEVLALKFGKISQREITAALNREADNQSNDGVLDEEAAVSDVLEAVMAELSRRDSSCAGKYPFELRNAGTTLVPTAAQDTQVRILYEYLLLSTRLNMNTNKIQAGIDGTALLEKLAPNVISGYLGGCNQAYVFGTSVTGGFRDKIDNLCSHLGEGDGHSESTPNAINKNDAGLDLVSWTAFSDKRPGKLIVFGQCKTGTNWKNELTKLQPSKFIKLWMRGNILHDPITSFFISESVDTLTWKDNSVHAGLLFDRCRIMEYCVDLTEDFLSQLAEWNQGALAIA